MEQANEDCSWFKGRVRLPISTLAAQKKVQLPIPAVDFTEPAPSIAKIFNKENRVYATPDKFFITKFRDIFQKIGPQCVLGWDFSQINVDG